MTKKQKLFFGAAIAVSLMMAGLLSPWASSSPDGLEKVAQDKGFLNIAAEKPTWSHSLMPDYSIEKITHSSVSTAAAGIIGTLTVLLMGFGVSKLIAAGKHKNM